MNSPHPPRKQIRDPQDRFLEDTDQLVDPDIVAEQIEAGYDIQADASTKPLVDDPASSKDNDDDLAND